MTLDEAIQLCEESAEENQVIVDNCEFYGANAAKCEERAKGCRQLAEWLKDYKRLLSAVEDIKAEIEQVSKEEKEYDMSWAGGLRYAIFIINKYINREEN